MPVQRPLSPLSPNTVKLCELCGTLNLDTNKECWTCSWYGGFSRDAKTIALAWQRLEVRYEGVRIEHVTGRRTRPVGDFGSVRPPSGPRKLASALTAWWHRFQDAVTCEWPSGKPACTPECRPRPISLAYKLLIPRCGANREIGNTFGQ